MTKVLVDPYTGEEYKKIELRTPYNMDLKQNSDETGTECEVETRTQIHMQDETDINLIMERYGMTGELPQNVRPVLMEEFEGVFDYQTAMNTLVEADRAFMQMPAGTRARFGNNPQNFLEFLAKEENRDEAVKMGLVMPRPKVEEKPPEKGDNEKGVT